jgi:hypothetical protein
MTMAKRNDTSKSHSPRNAQSSRAKSAPRHVIPEPVEDLIEEERERLMRAHTVLDCTLMSMNDDDSMPTDGPHYPSLIEIARDLVNESIRQLDVTNLQNAKPKDSEDALEKLPGGGYMVREAVPPPIWYEKRAANEASAPAPASPVPASVPAPASIAEFPQTNAL